LHPVNCTEETIAADVELSFFNQQRPFNIFLNNECRIIPKGCTITVLNDSFYFFKGAANLDAIATICVFPRFYYPNIFVKRVFGELFENIFEI
jgi:polyphosphate kinase 2 (PPK2 family)